jgi:hypothetical protein
MKWTFSADTTGWAARPIDPGQVYAQLILSGESSFPFHDSTGTGALRMMPLEGEAFYGKVVLDSTGVVVDIPLQISMEGIDRIDAAIWWPEDFGQDHRFVSLRIVDPDGKPGPISNAPMSIFQKTALVGPREGGEWKLRLSAESVRNSAQVIYWSAHVR